MKSPQSPPAIGPRRNSLIAGWRESLPARVALVTTGLLALVLALTISTSYGITALLLRRAVDSALMTTLPLSRQGVHDLLETPTRLDPRDDRDQYIQILDLTGQVIQPGSLPVDPAAVLRAVQTGPTFTSLVRVNGVLQERSGPDWWQALTPQRDEMRILYAPVRTEQGPAVLQLAAPLGSAGQVLPVLFWWLLLLGAVGSALAGAIAWGMAAQSYRPLRAITATASSINQETLYRRIDDRWRDRTLRQLIGVLNAMIARLEAAFEAQGRFAAAAAHELRSPLAAMRADLEVALRRPRSVDEYRQALEGALMETGRLADLGEHLLVLARYEHGAAPAVQRDVPLAVLLEQAAQEARRATGAEVQVTAPDGLTLDIDPIALERAVTNLIRNAIQAGGAPVTIGAALEGPSSKASPAAESSTVERGVLVVIEVQDHGPGIAPDLLPRIFEPFFRGDPSRHRDGGVGLGLAIVKAVVEAHGGSIQVDSHPGEGTTFRIRLPKVRA